MKITKRNLRNKDGEISLITETLDDLWHLKYIIEKEDLVYAVTKRKSDDDNSDKLRPKKAEKKTMRLGIKVESVEFHKFSNRLRVHGIIEHGMDIGQYHTINVEEDTKISIIKNWKNDQLERLNDAEAISKRPKVVIIVIEEGEADIGLLRHYGIEIYLNISQSSGKMEGTVRENFFKNIIDQLKYVTANNEAIIIAGPGFVKDDFFKYFKKHNFELSKNAQIEDISSIGSTGFQEVLKRGVVDRIVKESRLSKEAKLMDLLLKEISIDGKAAYGFDEVMHAMDFGAIKNLLITDEYLRLKREKDDIDSVLQKIEQSKGAITVLSTEFEPGNKLHALGGIASLLRFKI